MDGRRSGRSGKSGGDIPRHMRLYNMAMRKKKKLQRMAEESATEGCTFSPEIKSKKSSRKRSGKSTFTRLYEHAKTLKTKLAKKAADSRPSFAPKLVAKPLRRRASEGDLSRFKRLHGDAEARRRKKQARKAEEEERRLAECTFSPSISEGRDRRGRPRSKSDVHERLFAADHLQRKEAKLAERKEEELRKTCTFSPVRTARPASRMRRSYSSSDLFDRLHDESAKVRARRERAKAEQDSHELDGCSFKPRISPRSRAVSRNRSGDTFSRLFKDAERTKAKRDKRKKEEEAKLFRPKLVAHPAGRRTMRQVSRDARLQQLYERGKRKQEKRGVDRDFEKEKEEKELAECTFKPETNVKVWPQRKRRMSMPSMVELAMLMKRRPSLATPSSILSEDGDGDDDNDASASAPAPAPAAAATRGKSSRSRRVRRSSSSSSSAPSSAASPTKKKRRPKSTRTGRSRLMDGTAASRAREIPAPKPETTKTPPRRVRRVKRSKRSTSAGRQRSSSSSSTSTSSSSSSTTSRLFKQTASSARHVVRRVRKSSSPSSSSSSSSSKKKTARSVPRSPRTVQRKRTRSFDGTPPSPLLAGDLPPARVVRASLSELPPPAEMPSEVEAASMTPAVEASPAEPVTEPLAEAVAKPEAEPSVVIPPVASEQPAKAPAAAAGAAAFADGDLAGADSPAAAAAALAAALPPLDSAAVAMAKPADADLPPAAAWPVSAAPAGAGSSAAAAPMV